MEKRINAEERLQGFNRFVGIQIINAVPGRAEIALDVREELTNPMKIVHGGALFTLLDSAAGISAIYKENGNRPVVTQCATVHYLQPATSGRITAIGTLVKDGHFTALSRADVFDESGTLLATGDFEIFYTDNK